MLLQISADARRVAALDCKTIRQEVSIDSDDSSAELSMESSCMSSAASLAPAVDEEEENLAGPVSTASQQKQPDAAVAVDQSAINFGSQNKEQMLQAVLIGSADANGSDKFGHNHSSTVADEAENMNDVDMVHLYPEYLLSGVGLELLQLCMAMWSADPGARPSCEDIQERLATI